MIKSHVFSYKTFCEDLPKYLKEKELEFVSFSPNAILPTRLKEEQLQKVLENFWNGLYSK